jgi:hypothetical protein
MHCCTRWGFASLLQLHVDREAENVKQWVPEEYTAPPRKTEPISISIRRVKKTPASLLFSPRSFSRNLKQDVADDEG